MKKLAAAIATTILGVVLLGSAVAVSTSGHAAKPAPTAGSSWAGLGQDGLLGSILSHL